MSNAYIYIVMYLVTIIIGTGAAFAIWRRRQAPGGLALFLMQF